MNKMEYNELFSATLSMFKLDSKAARELMPNEISSLFEKVLKANKKCEEILKKPSVYGDGPQCMDSLRGMISSDPSVRNKRHQAASANG